MSKSDEHRPQPYSKCPSCDSRNLDYGYLGKVFDAICYDCTWYQILYLCDCGYISIIENGEAGQICPTCSREVQQFQKTNPTIDKTSDDRL